MVWFLKLDSAGKRLSGFTPVSTGQYSESPVGVAGLHELLALGREHELDELFGFELLGLGRFGVDPEGARQRRNRLEELDLDVGVFRPAPMPAELWIRASLMMPASRAASVSPFVRYTCRPLLLRFV